MIHFYLLKIAYSWKVVASSLFGIGVTTLAIGEVASNRTLIVISLISSGTTLIVTLIGAAVSLHNSRQLTSVATLPGKVDEFRKEVDGRMTELQQSRKETSEAKQEVARAEGVQQERTEERARGKGPGK